MLSIDPARHGSDETAASVRQGHVVRVMTSWSGCDLMESVTRIERLGTEWGVTPEWRQNGNRNRIIKARGEVVVDCVGLGAGLKDRSRRRCGKRSGSASQRLTVHFTGGFPTSLSFSFRAAFFFAIAAGCT